MGFFDAMKKVTTVMAEQVGSEYPNSICTEEYKCSCGMVRFFPESATPGVHVNAQPGLPCTHGNGTKHFFVKVNR